MWEGCDDAGNKELVGNSHEPLRMDETSERGQHPLQVVAPMIGMTMTSSAIANFSPMRLLLATTSQPTGWTIQKSYAQKFLSPQLRPFVIDQCIMSHHKQKMQYSKSGTILCHYNKE